MIKRHCHCSDKAFISICLSNPRRGKWLPDGNKFLEYSCRPTVQITVARLSQGQINYDTLVSNAFVFHHHNPSHSYQYYNFHHHYLIIIVIIIIIISIIIIIIIIIVIIVIIIITITIILFTIIILV